MLLHDKNLSGYDVPYPVKRRPMTREHLLYIYICRHALSMSFENLGLILKN